MALEFILTMLSHFFPASPTQIYVSSMSPLFKGRFLLRLFSASLLFSGAAQSYAVVDLTTWWEESLLSNDIGRQRPVNALGLEAAVRFFPES